MLKTKEDVLLLMPLMLLNLMKVLLLPKEKTLPVFLPNNLFLVPILLLMGVTVTKLSWILGIMLVE